MQMFRKRFGTRAVIVFVGLCALLLWAMRISLDSRPEQRVRCQKAATRKGVSVMIAEVAEAKHLR
jgi:hypothetical protein